ncbi:MAG: response regulator [Acidimicrobiia bacterium]|nr:response regulator [Acidimicrobiia bacterium]
MKALVVCDTEWVRSDVHSALIEPGTILVDEDDPAATSGRAAAEEVDVVVADLQVGSMGGMAITRAMKESSSLSGEADVPVVLLLDRNADAFLAKRAGAAAWVRKPFTAFELRAAVATALGVS